MAKIIDDLKKSSPMDGLLLKPDPEKEESEDSLFDGLIESIGGQGRFQHRLNLFFNCIFVTLLTMPFLNLIMTMSVPEHHCYVPGRDPEEFTLDEWWAKLPKTVDLKTGVETISSCKMYVNGTELVDCQHGHDYDRQWYGSTAPSDNDWVCGNELYVTNTFVASRVGEIFGIFVFGQLGDKIGRKPVYYISLVILLIGRTLLVVTSHIYSLFLSTVFLGSLAAVSVFQTPLVVGLEVSAEDRRAHIAFIQCVAWVVGSCMLPLIQWVVRDWKIFILVSTLPGCVVFFFYRFLPESPRWLASRGKAREAAEVLTYIAQVNGHKTPANMDEVLQKIAAKKEKTFGIASLFSSVKLAKNTLMIIICWVVASLSYYSLFLNISNMAGNPFMNFFWQALVELPGYIIGRYLSNKIGRRWSHTGCYVVVVLMCALVILTYGVSAALTTSLVTLVKFMVTITFYLVWLQAMEIYPTCVRQTGTSIGGLVANIFGVLGPYIVYLGTSIDARLPYVVLLCLGLLGVVCSSVLPETLNKKLPETLEDAKNFGTGQIFWSFNRTKKLLR